MRFLTNSALLSDTAANFGTKFPKFLALSMALATSFLLLSCGLFSSPWVAMRQCFYPVMHMQYQYSIFLNLVKVTLISCLIYCSSGPEHHCVFHIMFFIFRSTYAMWEPHFQKCFTILGACLPDYKTRRNLSFLCPLVCLGPGPKLCQGFSTHQALL